MFLFNLVAITIADPISYVLFDLLAITIDDPMFNYTSYIAYSTIPNALREVQLSLTFKPATLDDSILLYNSQTETGGGDFIALLIRDRHVELRYDSGSGMCPGLWYTNIILDSQTFYSGHKFHFCWKFCVNLGGPVHILKLHPR